jgi:hypothetical protein
MVNDVQQSAMVLPPAHKAKSAMEDQLQEFLASLGEFLEQNIYRVVKHQTTGKWDQGKRFSLKDLTKEGYCVIVVVYHYLKSTEDEDGDMNLEVRDSIIHLAAVISKHSNYDVDKSMELFAKVMVSTDGFHGLDQFYIPSSLVLIREYFQVLIQNYFGMETYEHIMKNTPDLPNLVIDMALGGIREIHPSLQRHDLAFTYFNILFGSASAWSVPQYQPAFALLNVALGVIQAVLNHDSQIFTKKGKALDIVGVKSLLHNSVYKIQQGKEDVFHFVQFSIRDNKVEKQQDTRVFNLAVLGRANLFTLYKAVQELPDAERRQRISQLFNDRGYLEFLQNFQNAYDFKYTPLRILYSKDEAKFIQAIRSFFVAMALLHASFGGANEYELLDVMAAALENVADSKSWKTHTAKLYSSETFHQSWKSVIGDELLKVQTSKSRHNKEIIAKVLKSAYIVDDKISKQQKRAFVHEAYAQDLNTLDKVLRMCTNHREAQDADSIEFADSEHF